MGDAVSTNQSLLQWIELGVHTEACMTRPETCGAAGGAISLWVKLIENNCIGILTSRMHQPETTGVNMFCRNFDSIVLVENYSTWSLISQKSKHFGIGVPTINLVPRGPLPGGPIYG